MEVADKFDYSFVILKIEGPFVMRLVIQGVLFGGMILQ